jgi:dipeptidyl-peptidase 4
MPPTWTSRTGWRASCCSSTAKWTTKSIPADKDFELLIVPGAEHTFIDCLAYVRKRCWDFLVRELMGTQPPAYRPAPIAIGPELLGELFA